VLTLVAFGLLLWWWSRTLESAMLGASSDSGSVKTVKAGGGGAVAALFPRALREVFPPNPFGAIVARESRSWWRDARRRAALISIMMASAVLLIALHFASRSAGGSTEQLNIPFSFAVTTAGTLGGMLLANQFAYDGSAYASHLLARVPGQVELRARAVALAVVTLPVQIAVTVAVTLLAGTPELIPAGLGLLATGFGSAVAAASLLSVLAAYPMPESTNPFALNSGGGSAKGMLAMVAIFGTLIISTPMGVAAFFLTGSAGAWLVFALGLGYGLGAARIGTIIAGDLIDRRGPELLIAVTPRR
jgi:ABC-2 type transport system permease protein